MPRSAAEGTAIKRRIGDTPLGGKPLSGEPEGLRGSAATDADLDSSPPGSAVCCR
eukprot:CAMPEP_0180014482 /NCGR_PEP_ID=MMETSP0984-20121128/18162_1 /TAXON_ID=483367 /ORGANISM="non described non described, Strain CCMP 2436" /LENGTH=54 /DNA_ID=CAMNT_0021937083 /DNA_START=881 /DNA_END=1042 /DNA_ORIENTATION=-